MTDQTKIDPAIQRLEVESGRDPERDTDVPIWEKLASIGASAPPGTWGEIPTDLSMRIDEWVYVRRTEDR